jgi:hypothetical protein
MGNCGKFNGDGDLILAIGKGLYDRNGGSNCNQASPLTFATFATAPLTSIIV